MGKLGLRAIAMKCRTGVVSLCSLAVLLAWVAPVRADDAIVIELKDFKFKPAKEIANPESLFSYDENAGKLCFYTNGPAEAAFKIPADGEYEIVISASGDSVRNSGDAKKDGPPKFKVAVDGEPVGKETGLTDDSINDYKLPVTLKAGDHKLVIEFTNDIYKEAEYDRNLFVHGVKLTPKK
jgi:predicted xylan-binding protein with Ca-dependent carbohydrate-binding module